MTNIFYSVNKMRIEYFLVIMYFRTIKNKLIVDSIEDLFVKNEYGEETFNMTQLEVNSSDIQNSSILVIVLRS